MKDLIFISAYCPDENRESILRELVISLNKFKERFDIMVVSHTTIPLDIQKKVDICVFDKKNEILTDWDLLNQPWFNPNDERRIQSSFLSKKNTHLAIWRMFILGFSLAKNAGYKKIHAIEYDSIISNTDEFVENSNLLEKYDYVAYIKKAPTVDDILFGSFLSINLDKIHPFLLKLDEDAIKQMIRDSSSKSPELLLQNLIDESNNVFYKDRVILDNKGNKFGIIDGQIENEFIPWGLPFYDPLTNKIDFLVWNTKNPNGVEYSIIVNRNKFIYIDKTLLNHWRLVSLGSIDEIETILVLENNKLKDNYIISTEEEKEIFKKSSFRSKNPD